MNELLLNAQRARFGQSSEKCFYVMRVGQKLEFLNEAEAEQDCEAPELAEEMVTVADHNRVPNHGSSSALTCGRLLTYKRRKLQ